MNKYHTVYRECVAESVKRRAVAVKNGVNSGAIRVISIAGLTASEGSFLNPMQKARQATEKNVRTRSLFVGPFCIHIKQRLGNCTTMEQRSEVPRVIPKPYGSVRGKSYSNKSFFRTALSI